MQRIGADFEMTLNSPFIRMTAKTVILRHCLVWLIFISYEMTYIKIMVGIHASVFHFIVFYLLNVSLFYFNAHVLLDFAFFKTQKPYPIAIFLIVIEIAVYLGIKYSLDTLLSKWFPADLKFNARYILINAWRGVYFLGFSIAYWSMLYMIRFRERNYRMETEQLKSMTRNLELENKYMSVENAYLQNQISPHLLFNSLNFIYNTVYLKSEKAGQGVMLLADLMRYSLVGGDEQRTVLLSSEVEQIDNLVQLSRLRFGEELFLRFQKKGKWQGVRIIPLILITLVENLMKHGDLGEATRPALIRLEHQNGHLIFETRNKKRTSPPYSRAGLGLKNIEKRLNNYYQERYTLQVKDVEDLFSVTLTINL